MFVRYLIYLHTKFGEVQEWLNWLPWKGSVLARVPWVRIPLSPLHYSNYYSMHIIFVLYNKKLYKRYIGSTKDIEKRLRELNLGKSKFTKSGIPWILIYKESFSTNIEARQRELFLKSGIGRKFLDEILN